MTHQHLPHLDHKHIHVPMVVYPVLQGTVLSHSAVLLIQLGEKLLTVSVRVWVAESKVECLLARVRDGGLEGENIHTLLRYLT